jgi:hypothetical protein
VKRAVAAVLACLMALPAWAQETSPTPTGHVRITGVKTCEIPGVIKLEGDRISGRSATITDRDVQIRRPGKSRLLTVPRPGKRVTGRVRAIEGALLEFVRVDEEAAAYVPQDSILLTSLNARRHWSRTGTEIVVTVVAIVGVLALILVGNALASD